MVHGRIYVLLSRTKIYYDVRFLYTLKANICLIDGTILSK